MIAALLAVTLCTADTATFTPTPTVKWSISDESRVDGYNVYYRQSGDINWTLGASLPCWLDDSDVKWCRGTYLDYPIQRIPVSEGILYDFAIRSYGPTGESAKLSNVQQACPPHIWVKPEHYQ